MLRSASDQSQYGEPRNPNRIIGLSYFLTTIGAGYLLADNWKRLGKPEWARNTFRLSIAAAVGALVIIVGTIALVTSSESERQISWLLFPGLGMGFGINFGFMYALLSLQSPAYKTWQSDGQAALQAHTYNFRRARLIFIGFVALSAIGFTLLYLLFSNH